MIRIKKLHGSTGYPFDGEVLPCVGVVEAEQAIYAVVANHLPNDTSRKNDAAPINTVGFDVGRSAGVKLLTLSCRHFYTYVNTRHDLVIFQKNQSLL